MISGKQIGDLTFPKRKKKKAREMTKVIGIDTEAYVDGSPFMVATDLGEVFTPGRIPRIFFTPRYRGANFIFYNIKYDSGAILYHLPAPALRELWEWDEVRWNGFTYRYIPHKALTITDEKNRRVVFWDVSQFYKSSLDRASRTYLHKRKMETRTKRFSRPYVKRCWNHIAKYCLKDARLCGELGRYFISRLSDFGIVTSSIYSCASITYDFFVSRTKISTCRELFDGERKLVAMACDAYAGGKFEVTARGSFTGHSYDIVSAYPHEIRNLVSLDNCIVLYGRRYEPEAAYGFLRVRVDNRIGAPVPCGLKKGSDCIFPAGVFYTTITKAEYDYLLTTPVGVDILDAGWIFCDTVTYPYRDVIDDLFRIKADAKKTKDKMLYNTSKILMNSAYGKMAQVTWDKKKEQYVAGPWWNPVHAAAITANTRITVTRLQAMLGKRCLAVHTDSVMCLDELPPCEVSGELGGLEHEIFGRGIVVASGMYEIADKTKYRGFRMRRGMTWRRLLKKYPGRMSVRVRQLHVESWVEAQAKGHPKEAINVFENTTKKIDLNCDEKRLWKRRIKSDDLLDGLEYSFPIVVNHDKIPREWLIKNN